MNEDIPDIKTKPQGHSSTIFLFLEGRDVCIEKFMHQKELENKENKSVILFIFFFFLILNYVSDLQYMCFFSFIDISTAERRRQLSPQSKLWQSAWKGKSNLILNLIWVNKFKEGANTFAGHCIS